MKHLVLFMMACMGLAFVTHAPQFKKDYLTGIVLNEKGEPFKGVAVTATQNRVLIQTTETNAKGEYQLPLKAGVYDIEFVKAGYRAIKVVEVAFQEKTDNILNISLQISLGLEETLVTDRKEGLSNNGSGSSIDAGEISIRGERSAPTPTRKEGKMKTKSSAPAKEGRREGVPTEYKTTKSAEKPAGAAPPVMSDDVKVHSTAPTSYHIDGVRATGTPPPAPDAIAYEDVPASMAIKHEKTFSHDLNPDVRYDVPVKDMITTETEEIKPSPKPTDKKAPRAGLLTAGEWNDLHNWNRHWVDLQNDGEIAAYETMYAFYPRQRYTLLLTNEQDIPLSDVPVALHNDKGDLIWESRTDNTGKAELWAHLHQSGTIAFTDLKAFASIEGKKHEFKALKEAKNGINVYRVAAACNASKNVDIVWAVDATGSMGDEIEYLKTELLDVIGRAKSRNSEISFRMGTTFYKDKNDEYLTKSSGLSYDISKTVDFIRSQSAGGGGDYPEAVHTALDEAIFAQKWSEYAIARICFLVLDASPHQLPEVNASLQNSIREAARRGIRIVPIAASGIQKDTEFLMKFFALATNGTYVFLTDHSGIGGKHLEPTTDEYKVEPLNDLLVRLITEYSSTENCDGQSKIRFENDPQQQAGQVWEALYYPNPASTQFTLELPVAAESVTIYDSEGKGVRKIENPGAGAHPIQVSDLPSGFYTIRILCNGRMQSGKLMVVRQE